MRPLVKKLFCRSDATSKSKAAIADSNAISKCAYGAATWPRLSQAESKAFANGVHKVYAIVACMKKYTGKDTFNSHQKVIVGSMK